MHANTVVKCFLSPVPARRSRRTPNPACLAAIDFADRQSRHPSAQGRATSTSAAPRPRCRKGTEN
ncbi:hypothetical protein B5M45_18695 [Mycobacterium simiae]|uniref:Uncharacterized protein n=1 Tax=Mycobacterium simiae TaxID=1784 RepID=A0A1X0Y032_MYCSI|nr:hypothetical protein B5M45_18695 [Mycobacterium simiae]